ncbi:DUF481 domain-containing protein [Symbiopectobacterium sp. Eva_TO]
MGSLSIDQIAQLGLSSLQVIYYSEQLFSLKAGETRSVVGAPAGAGQGEQTLALTNIKSIVTAKPFVTDFSWKGNIDAGMSHKKSSTETENYDVTLDTRMRHGTWRHNVDGTYHEATENDVRSTKNASGEYALDKFLDV